MDQNIAISEAHAIGHHLCWNCFYWH